MAKIEEAKSAGKPMTEDQIRSLIASKAKAISDEVSDSFKAKSQADIETIRGRAAEGGRNLSKKEQAAIARREDAFYKSAKERADEIEAQAKSVAAGGEKSIATRVETLKGLSPEEQRMSGVKAKLYREKAVAQSKNETAFVTRLEKMAADKKLLPIKDKEGKQVMEEIIIDGEKMTVPKYETRAEQSLRLEKESAKAFSAKDEGLKPVLDDDGKQVFEKVTIDGKEMTVPKYTNPDGSPYVHKKAPSVDAANPKDAAAKAASGKETESSARLRRAQEENAAKAPPRLPLGSGSSKQTPWSELVKLPNRAGYTDEQAKEVLKKLGETADAPKVDVPKSELKGRKWVRDASGKLVLAKK
jgi:hypothetical protein